MKLIFWIHDSGRFCLICLMELFNSKLSIDKLRVTHDDLAYVSRHLSFIICYRDLDLAISLTRQLLVVLV